MKKIKLLSILGLIFSVAIFFNACYASEEMLDIYGSSNSTYSISEDEKDIYLPFMRFSNGSMVIDKQVNNMGGFFSSRTIDINSDINKMSAIFATDTIRVNADVKNSVLFSTTAIVIDSHITSDLILFSTSEITITKNAIIDGDIICFTSNLNVLGTVNGSVIANSSNVDVSGIIMKDLRVSTQNIKIESEEAVKGNLYIESYEIINEIKEKYPNVINKIIEENKIDVKSEIKNIIFVSIVYALLYLLLTTIKKGELLKCSFEKIKQYKNNMIISGAIGILIIPIIVMVALILLILGLYMIAIPLLVLYFAFVIVSAILSIFIVGSMINMYIKNKYLQNKSNWHILLVAFISFLILHIISKIPYISGIVSALYLMGAFGILFVCIFKRIKKDC